MAKLCILQIVSDWTGPLPPELGPPGIWGGGNVPMPSPPIANVPGAPGYQPPVGGGGPPGVPTHPIYYPPVISGGPGSLPPWAMPPIYYPPAGGGGGPPGIWGGGNVPMPTPPIANVPGAPGYVPPGPWEPNFPTPPIFLPPGGETPPIDPPHDPQGRWLWIPGLGWVWMPGSEDMQPHK